ncbi:MAG: hypothetical protein FWB96_13145 [Defluviitaleaceae bacterium]|nr:hypothetical protein [Defluviitaleaceae bacterium]MCL2264176.1 hypothetical protein [Defluviitaleaceae bacterium]
MKIHIALLVILLLGFAACGGDAEQTEDITPTPDIEVRNEHSLEELGATIIAASEFWDDWWGLRGAFEWGAHIDSTPWYYWAEQPEHPRSRGMDVLLPSSGFESLNDIADYLSQFYTSDWIARELFGEGSAIQEPSIFFGSPWAFVEYDGAVYVATARIGTMRPDWTTAIHTLIEQNGNRALVDTVVTAYDHRGSGDEMPTATFSFVFIDGKIESGYGAWVWPEIE